MYNTPLWVADILDVVNLEILWGLWPIELIKLRDALIFVKSLQSGCFQVAHDLSQNFLASIKEERADL
jgi:hypothetical protein